jgi:diguanylate cyclase (GGDEF)-like protein
VKTGASIEEWSDLRWSSGGADSLGDLLTQQGGGKTLTLEAGHCLWQEGDPADSVIFLREGELEVVSARPDCEDVIVLRRLGPGAVLGEISCLDGGRRSAGVRAEVESIVTRYPLADFRALLRRRPQILEPLLIQQLETVRHLTAQVTQHHRRAITDQLTQLYNLGFFVERLGLELERAEKTGDGLAVIMLDIDHFKRFNDRYGHQAGNEVLVQMGHLLKRSGRRGDIMARYGGEEFIVLLYGANHLEACAFAERVRRKVEAMNLGHRQAQSRRGITVSGGVACYPEDAKGLDSLILAADANLYRAKEQGRNRVSAAGAAARPRPVGPL